MTRIAGGCDSDRFGWRGDCSRTLKVRPRQAPCTCNRAKADWSDVVTSQFIPSQSVTSDPSTFPVVTDTPEDHSPGRFRWSVSKDIFAGLRHFRTEVSRRTLLK